MSPHSLRTLLSASGALALLIAGAASASGQTPAKNAAADRDLYGDPLPNGAIARLGSVRFHHPAGLVAMAFGPDGKSFLAVGGDAMRIWETDTGKELARFDGGKESRFSDMRNAKFSPDGKHIAVNHSKSVELLDRQTGKTVRTFAAKHEIISCAFSPDGKWLAAGCMEWQEDNPIRVWEVETGRELAPFPGRGVSLHALTFSTDGKRLFSGPPGGGYSRGNNGGNIPAAICIWDVETRKKLREIDYNRSNVAFALNGELLAYEDDGIRVLSAATGETVCRIPAKNPSFAFTPNSTALASLDQDRELRLWEAATGKEIRRFSGHFSQGSRLASFSPDGKRLALMDGHWAHDGSIRIWDVATGVEVRIDGGHVDVVSHVAFAPGGKLLASASRDRSVRIWDAATGNELQRLLSHTAPVFAVAFSPDGKTLASASDDGTTRLWDVASGNELAQFKHPPGRVALGMPRTGGTLAFSADGKTLTVACTNGMAATWDWLARKEIRRLLIDDRSSASPAIVPLTDNVLTANSHGWAMMADSAQETLRLWSLTTGSTIHVLPLRSVAEQGSYVICEALAASADGRMLASSQIVQTQGLRLILGNPEMKLWERATGREILSIKETMGQALAFSPDGSLLAADDGKKSGWGYAHETSVSLWDTMTGVRQGTLAGHTAAVHSIAFSPNGKTMATGSADHSILVWTTPLKKLAPAAGGAPAGQIQTWWNALAGADAAAAHQAAGKLIRNPAPAVRVIGDNLKPALPIDDKKFPPLIADLDSPEFEVRNEAYLRLEAMGDLASLALHAALQKPSSLEAKRRLELLVNNAAGLTPRHLLALRALTVLERIANPEARQVLEALASGAPAARVTAEAQLVLQRLNAR